MRTRYHCLAGMALVCLFIVVDVVPLSAQLPDPGMDIELSNTALVITDPQNDFLSPDGVMWGVVGQSVTENNTVENIDRLFRSAKRAGLKIFISPHYYFPTDHGWKFERALERLMHNVGMFDRKGQLNMNSTTQ